MSYFSILQTQEWVHICSPTESYYRLKIGTSGINGCCVPNLLTKEYKHICQWFMTKNVVVKNEESELVKNEESELWWSHTRYSYNRPVPGNRRGIPINMRNFGGYEFRMSCEAYAVVFK